MELKEILAKVVKGDSLTDEEKKYLSDWKEDGRIPKERLDQEIAKRRDAECKGTELSAKVDELTQQLEDLKNSGLSDAERAKNDFQKQLNKLQRDLDAVTKQRDDSAKELSDLKFNGAVREIATKYGFTDPDYLGFRLKGADIAIDDESGVGNFVKTLEQSNPHLFSSTAKPGGGTGAGGNGSPADQMRARMEELISKPQLSSREQAEVVELSDRMKSSANN